MDHFYQLSAHGSVEEPFLDAWTVLPALAAVTSRIRLGAMVSPVGYRNPALLARMGASLDHISSGRMNFGFGAGGYKPEYQAYGFKFIEEKPVRLAQMKEALQLILGLWVEPCFTFHGEYFHVEDAIDSRAQAHTKAAPSHSDRRCGSKSDVTHHRRVGRCMQSVGASRRNSARERNSQAVL